METTDTISISTVGTDSGLPFEGTFTVKTLLSRNDRFAADEARRRILGANGTTALPALMEEAYMLGQLLVRVVKGPDWWTNSNNGLDLTDLNVITELYDLAVAKERERKAQLSEAAKAAIDRVNASKK